MLSAIVLLAIIVPAVSQNLTEDLEPPDEFVDNRVITTLKFAQSYVKPGSVHGRPASSTDFPFLVSIKRSFQAVSRADWVWSNYCGGSIINPSKILTAAHCFDLRKYHYFHHPEELRVVAGSVSNNMIHSADTTDSKFQQWRKMRTVKLHPDFHFPLHDIALVFVDAPFIYSKTIRPVGIARTNADYKGHCYSAGYGQVGVKQAIQLRISRDLLWAEMRLMTRDQCAKRWGMEMRTFVCSDSIFRDVSSGDSGGPLTCMASQDALNETTRRKRYLLVGIVGGRNNDKTRLYTRVSEYSSWIDRNGSIGSRAEAFNFVVLFVIKFLCMCFDRIYFLVDFVWSH